MTRLSLAEKAAMSKVFDALAKQSALSISNIGLYDKLDRKAKEKIKDISTLFTMSKSASSCVDLLNSIKTLAKIIDANDPYTHGHCGKVMKYSILICRALRLQPRDTNAVKTASLLHDIGKIGIDLNILRKESKLNEEDWKKIRLHPEIGAKIVSQAGFLNEIVPLIKHHHERYDGGGYPDPMKRGARIPVGARIIAVADAYDAMTSDRPYRKAMAEKDAIEELKKCAGCQFDPAVVNAFIHSKKT